MSWISGNIHLLNLGHLVAGSIVGMSPDCTAHVIAAVNEAVVTAECETMDPRCTAV
jgi:hypothetical protein